MTEELDRYADLARRKGRRGVPLAQAIIDEGGWARSGRPDPSA